jgi:hypothetical protein
VLDPAVGAGHRLLDLQVPADERRLLARRQLPGPETVILAVKHPARPYKTAIENQFT